MAAIAQHFRVHWRCLAALRCRGRDDRAERGPGTRAHGTRGGEKTRREKSRVRSLGRRETSVVVLRHPFHSLESIPGISGGPTALCGRARKPPGTPRQCCVAARGSDAAAARVGSRQCATRPAAPCLGSVLAVSSTATRPIRRPEKTPRMQTPGHAGGGSDFGVISFGRGRQLRGPRPRTLKK
jgi:hypothetical protein